MTETHSEVHNSPNIFNSVVSVFFALGTFSLTANADEAINTNVTSTKITQPGLHFVVSGGLTYGGDKVGSILFTTTGVGDVKAGSLIEVGLGALYQFEAVPLAVMITTNHHSDNAMTFLGKQSIAFDRPLVEVLAYYNARDNIRYGGGVRIIDSATLESTMWGATEVAHYHPTTGIVCEIGYGISPELWINFRLVSESYRMKDYSGNGVAISSLSNQPKIDGSHVGVNFVIQF